MDILKLLLIKTYRKTIYHSRKIEIRKATNIWPSKSQAKEHFNLYCTNFLWSASKRRTLFFVAVVVVICCSRQTFSRFIQVVSRSWGRLLEVKAYDSTYLVSGHFNGNGSMHFFWMLPLEGSMGLCWSQRKWRVLVDLFV